jgi:DNA (cytosine-5)-methyltransferase 1
MGRYRQQYLYRCPHAACRGQAVEPAVLPAAAAIDWSLPGQRIGDRAVPLKPKTIARIEAGLRRYARPVVLQTGGSGRNPASRTHPVSQPLTTQTAQPTKALACPPLLIPAGGTWRQQASPADEPMPCRTATEADGVAFAPFITVHRGGPGDIRVTSITEPLATVAASGNHLGLAVPPPLLVPVEGRDGKEALPAGEPMRTQTARAETALAIPPFIAVLRGNCDATPITSPLGSVTTSGSHHALVAPDGAVLTRDNTPRGGPGQTCTPVTEPARTITTAGHQSLLTWDHLLVPYYRTGIARPVTEPVGTLPATERYGLAAPAIDISDVLFRMLEPAEIAAAMAFHATYQVTGSKRERVRQLGNAVTPPVAEILISALAEAISPGGIQDAA